MYEEEPSDFKSEPQHYIQHELAVIAFMDYICDRPLSTLYSEKVIDRYQTKILNELVSARYEVRESWIDNRVDDGITQIIQKNEEVAQEAGFPKDLRKESLKLTLPLMIASIAIFFVLFFFVSDMFLMYMIFIPIMLIMCCVPRIVNQRLVKRIQLLSEEVGPQAKEAIRDITERLYKFTQFLIDDVREILAANDMDFDNYRLMLFNSNYENVKVLQEQTQKNLKFYVMELLPIGGSIPPSESSEPSEENKFD